MSADEDVLSTASFPFFPNPDMGRAGRRRANHYGNCGVNGDIDLGGSSPGTTQHEGKSQGKLDQAIFHNRNVLTDYGL
jgi:hypothetical protein